MELLDGAARAADDGGCLLEAEVSEDAESEDVALVGRQAGQERVDALVAVAVLGFVLCGRAAAGVGVGVVGARVGSSGAGAEAVDGAGVGDGEHEGSEAGYAAGQGWELGEDGQEHVLGELFWVGGAAAGEVAVDLPGERSVEDVQCPRFAELRGGQRVGQGAGRDVRQGGGSEGVGESV